MKHLVYATGLLVGLTTSSALAQNSLTTASPIPDGAFESLCYYAGMAYSPHAYIVVAGKSTRAGVTSLSGGTVGSGSGGQAVVATEQHAFECIEGDDGNMRWIPRATIQGVR